MSIAAAVIVLDQVTKTVAENLLTPGRFVPFLGSSIGWQLVYNPGAAFGIPAPPWVFLLVTVVVVIVVGRTLPRTGSLVQAGAYGLLLAGAIGNVLDRLFRGGSDAPGFGRGEVVDFVAWGTFPRFNVADSAITVGFVLLIVTLWFDERRTRAAGQPGPTLGTDAADEEVADPDGRDGDGPAQT